MGFTGAGGAFFTVVEELVGAGLAGIAPTEGCVTGIAEGRASGPPLAEERASEPPVSRGTEGIEDTEEGDVAPTEGSDDAATGVRGTDWEGGTGQSRTKWFRDAHR